MTKKQIDSILFGIEVNSWNRFKTFTTYIPILKGKNYWYALRNSYEMSDNLYELSGLVKASFLKDEPFREYLMNTKERNYLKGLPETMKIFRGMTEKELKSKSFGISWTLKKEVAEFFINEYQRNYSTNNLKKVVHEIIINKNQILAFLNDRKEFEIIYIHENK
jgi:hypothetical protein